jgi:hypothetical protein
MTNEEAIKYLQQLYPYGGHCWLDERRTEAIGMAIEALREKSKLSSIERNGKDCKDDPVSDDFEEACNQMSEAARISKCEAGKPFFSDGDYKLGFKAGANWQKEQDKQWLAENHKHIFNNGYEEGFEAGRDDMEDEMMKDAKDYTLSETPLGLNPMIRLTLPNGKYHKGDEVKIIIIKKTADD